MSSISARKGKPPRKSQNTDSDWWLAREYAHYLRTSVRFVQKNWEALGGKRWGGNKKRAGVIRFPNPHAPTETRPNVA
jgi:hypothetical protein